jgi:phosphoribosyl 1,2-cyclic phosphodiesterase
MRATIWGCRGSIAAPGPSTVRYGGNTSCVEVRLRDGSVVVLDAGTGMRELGRRLVAEGVEQIHLLLSHLHLDHLQGLAFFAPLYTSGVELHVWGPPSPTRSLEDRVGSYMSDPLFPVSLGEVPARLVFHDAPFEGADIGSAHVDAAPVMHRGPTVGWRLDEGGRSLVYLPDHEPALGTDFRTSEVAWVSGYALAYRADVLIHDAQYTEEEISDHVGWGHSSVAQAVGYAKLVKVEQLVLFHHDPSHDDATLEALHARAGELWGPEGPAPVIAAEGMSLDLAATVGTRWLTPLSTPAG